MSPARLEELRADPMCRKTVLDALWRRMRADPDHIAERAITRVEWELRLYWDDAVRRVEMLAAFDMQRTLRHEWRDWLRYQVS